MPTLSLFRTPERPIMLASLIEERDTLLRGYDLRALQFQSAE